MNTRSIKPGDIVYVETKAEKGYALVETVVNRDQYGARCTAKITYVPLAGEWQKGRVYREPATARQITGLWSHRHGGNA